MRIPKEAFLEDDNMPLVGRVFLFDWYDVFEKYNVDCIGDRPYAKISYGWDAIEKQFEDYLWKHPDMKQLEKVMYAQSTFAISFGECEDTDQELREFIASCLSRINWRKLPETKKIAV